MQKIDRAFVAKPAFLSGDEVLAHDKQVRAHFRLQELERLRQRAPDAGKLLHHNEVVASVRKVFSGKCAYCETVLEDSARHVSHFRPRSNATQARQMRDSPDHYAWFATEWRNLVWSCYECEEYKSNLFPVVDGRRAMPLCTWGEAKRTEAPLLLDPCVDQPRKHFAVDREGRLIPLTEQGTVTLEVLRLNRPALQTSRARAIGLAIERITSPSQRIVNADWADHIPHHGALSIFLHGLCRYAIEFAVVRRMLLSTDLKTVAEHLHNEGAAALLTALSEMESKPVLPFRPPEPSLPDTTVRQAQLAHARLISVKISNFKGIDALHLHLDGAGVNSAERQSSAMLLGENSTGKSSVLQAIALALMKPSEIKKLNIDPEDYLSRDSGNWRFDKSRKLSVELEFMNEQSCTLVYSPEHNSFETVGKVPVTLLGYGSRRFFRATRDGVPNKTLFDPMAVLPDPAAWLQSLSEHEFNAVARATRSILALQPDDTILRDPDGTALVKAHGRVSPVDRMSDGYRSLFAMAIDIMRRMIKEWGNLEFARGIVLIDEIETHLHPRWKLRVMAALRDAMPMVQFIVTTHDPLCLRGMRNGEVHVLFREEEGKVVLLKELPNIETLRAEQILVSDFFGLFSTSDPEQEKILRELATLARGDDSELAPEERVRRDMLLEQYGGIPTIGVSLDRQILAAAITVHLQNHPTRTLVQEASMRENSIKSIVDVLKRNLVP